MQIPFDCKKNTTNDSKGMGMSLSSYSNGRILPRTVMYLISFERKLLLTRISFFVLYTDNSLFQFTLF